MRPLTRRAVRHRVVAVGAAVALALSVVGAAAPAAAENGGQVTLAACTLNLAVDLNPGIGLVPGPAALSLVGGGTCVMNGKVVQLSIGGTLFALSNRLGCALGAASGLVTMTAPSLFPGEDAVTTTAVNAGGLWSVLFSKTGSSIVLGVGVFAQAAATTLACASTTNRETHSTWTGGAVLFDPTVPSLP